MGILATQPLTAGSVRQRPPFLRDWSFENTQLASCATHDHLALIYDNQEEQLDIVVPFLRLGLERGEKSVYIIDDSDPAMVIAAMERHGIDVDAATATGALAIITKYDAYLKSGDFDPDWMIGFLAQAVEDAKREGFHAVRASGEMTWALGPGGDVNSRLIEYECRLNTFFPQHDMGGICQYNRRRFRPETLMHVIHTHPRIVFRGEVCDNPYYIPAEIFQGFSNGTEDPFLHLLEGMAENTRLHRRLSAETEALCQSEKLVGAGRMAATIAHEINNPLEAIVNLWYLLKRENLSPEGVAYLQAMGKELNRVSHIAKQTLAFYRIGAAAESLDLGQLIDEAAQLFSRRAESRGTAVQIQHRGSLSLNGFAGELRQLFANLIGNALEAGAGRIHIRMAHSHDWKKPARRGVRIVIADNGGGIPSVAAARVFEPFFTTKGEKGTGLGLWVSKGIVQKHEGSISMRTSTRPGRSGTAFSIFLPAA
ncbi:MAG: MEDS domain-containing protein [Acidobacteriaceae bacterium]